MTPEEIIVTLIGVGAIGWIYWYFFLAGRGRGGERRER